MANLDFCAECGCWIAANTGIIRTGPDGEVEIICDECKALEQNEAVSVSHDYRSGMLNNG